MAHQQASLIKWNSPSLVSTSETKGKKKEKFAKSEKGKNGEKSVSSADGADERLPVEERLEILNSILPARNWEKDGQVWVQHVSPVPATTVDVVNTAALMTQGEGGVGCWREENLKIPQDPAEQYLLKTQPQY